MFKYEKKKIDVKYDSGLHYTIEYLGNDQLIWTDLGDGIKGASKSGTENFYYWEVGDGIYNFNWIEETGISVSQTINFNDLKAYSFIAWNDDNAKGKRAFSQEQGSISFID
jgi:phenolic acid decarboxylase